MPTSTDRTQYIGKEVTRIVQEHRRLGKWTMDSTEDGVDCVFWLAPPPLTKQERDDIWSRVGDVAVETGKRINMKFHVDPQSRG